MNGINVKELPTLQGTAGDIFAQGMNALATGGDLNGTLSSAEDFTIEERQDVEILSDEPFAEAQPEADPSDAVEGQAAEATEGDAEATPAAADSKELPTVETIKAAGKQLKVDWSNREAIKKQIALAAGAQQWRQERDKARTDLKALEPELAKLRDVQATFSKLDEAWKNGGVAGLVNLLEGKPDAYQRHIEAQFQRQQERSKATPAELERMELQERLEREQQERLQLQRRMDEQLKQAEQARSDAMSKQLKSRLEPAFEKYRFAGKLGDEVAEQHFDEAVWTKAMSAISALPDDVELTPAAVDAEFRKAAQTFRKHLVKQAEAKANAAIATKKEQAAKAVTAATTKQYAASAPAKSEAKMADAIRKGDYLAAIQSMFG